MTDPLLYMCMYIIYVTLEHKRSTGIFVAMADFSLMPKIIRILRSCSMKIFCKFPTINISKLNFDFYASLKTSFEQL